MSELQLTAHKRKELSRKATKQMRRQGEIPAVLYGGKDTVPLILNKKELKGILSSVSGGNVLFTLKLQGDNEESSERRTIIKELQYRPVTDQLLHVDLMEITKGKKIVIHVPLKSIGENVCTKKTGGIVNHIIREIDIECLPVNMPKEINIDISNLEIGHAVHVRDIDADKNIKILNDPDETILTLALPKAQEEEKEVVEGEPADAEDKVSGETEKEVT